MDSHRTLLLAVNSLEDSLAITHYATILQPGYSVIKVATAEETLVWCQNHRPDVIVLDWKWLEKGGLDLITALRNCGLPSPPIVILAESGHEELAIQAFRWGVADYVLKGESEAVELFAAIDRCIGDRQSGERSPAQTMPQDASSVLSALPAVQPSRPDHLKRQELEHQAFWQQIVDAVPQIVFWKDCRSQQWGCNQNLLELAHVSSIEALMGTDCATPWHNLINNCSDDLQMMTTGMATSNHVALKLNQSGLRWFKVNKIPLRDLSGEIIGLIGICEDVTERKQEQEALLRSESTNEAIFQAIPDLLIRMSRDGIYRAFMSGGAVKVIYPSNPADLTTVFEMLPPHLAKLRLYYTQQALETGRLQIYEQEIEIDGALRYEEVRIAVCSADEVLTIIRDITDQKKAKESLKQLNQELEYRVQERTIELQSANHQLRQEVAQRQAIEAVLQSSQMQMQSIAANVPGMLFQYVMSQDGSARFTYASSQCRSIFEVEPEQLVVDAKLARCLIHPDDFALFADALADSAQNLLPFRLELRIVAPSGCLKWLRCMSSPHRHGNGDIVWDGIVFDISDLKQAELQLMQNQDLKSAIFNESADAIFLVDSETLRTVDCNQRAVALFEAEHKNDLINIEGCTLQLHPFSEIELLEIANAMSKEKFWSSELEFVTLKGKVFWGNIAAKQICVAGKVMDLVRVTDVTERVMAKRQLQQMNDQLLKANSELARATRLKDEFLATMSHELRTPLNAILGLSEALQAQIYGELKDRQIWAIATIEKSGQHLLNLINDILDVAKIESGTIDLRPSPVSVRGLCAASLQLIRQQASKKNIQVNMQIAADLGWIWIDERRLQQILINLLSNAVKFTPDGGSITLKVDLQHNAEHCPAQPNPTLSDQQERLWLSFSVIDTGIGIAPTDLATIFEAFMQVDSRLSRSHDGTGLGLALVKQLTELQGGSVTVTSELGQGSCFTVYLPYWPNRFDSVADGFAKKDIPKPAPPQLIRETQLAAPLLILVVEDHPANAEMLCDYLDVGGYEAIVAHNGLEAIAQAKAHHPHLILMDLQMPLMDGLEAIRQIRQEPELAQTPIVALTAMAMQDDKDRCLRMGADDYISKPFGLSDLLQKLDGWLKPDL